MSNPTWAEVYEALQTHGWRQDHQHWGDTDSGRTAPDRLYRRGKEMLFLRTGLTPARVTWGRYVGPEGAVNLPRAATTAAALTIVTAPPPEGGSS